MRRDTLRNREALIAAAQRVFEAEGIDAPLENIAADQGIDRHTSIKVSKNHPAPCQIGHVPPARQTR